MSEVSIKLRFNDHPCTNLTDGYFRMPDKDCENQCAQCRCDSQGYCCGEERNTDYCADCGHQIECPPCYPCNGEECSCGIEIPPDVDVTYTGNVQASWKNGELAFYRGNGHPHLDGSHCLGEVARLFENVTTTAKAIEAVLTHISNVDFHDAINGSGPYLGIEVA